MIGQRSSWIAAAALLFGVTALGPTPFSTAAFVASTSSTATVVAAEDWTPPTVEVVAPGAAVKGAVEVAVDARDEESGISRVVLEVMAPDAAEWTTVCTDTAAPWNCTWQTASLPDGAYTLRAQALDGSGLETLSELVEVRVANKLAVFLESPGDAVRGTVALETSVHNVGTAAHTVRVEYAVSGTTTWRTLCSNLKAPYGCAWNTTALAADFYDLRAVLVVGSTTTYSAVVEEVEVDNLAPTAVLVDPGAVLSGAVTFSATAHDAHSGLDRVVVQHAPAGSTTWRELCVRADEPWSCRFDTTTLADGQWNFRAVVTDVAGNTATSAVVGPRTIDNTISSVVVDVPSVLTKTVSIGAIASSTAGITKVELQYAASGTTAFTTICADTTSPYACLWDTSTVADGQYDLRAVMTDARARVTTSSLDSGNLVSNSPLRGVDVQTRNGSLLSGRPGSGDIVEYTFSSEIRPSSVLAGWTGQARAVTLRLRDGVLLGRSSKEDGFDVLAGSATVNLGQVNLKRDHVRTNRTVSVNATMTASTLTAPDGASRSVVTLRLESTVSGSSRLRTATGSGTMIWSPSSQVTDLLGRASAPTAVSESGPADKEF